MPLEIQVLGCRSARKWSPVRARATSRIRLQVRWPASGSVSARPPRTSPEASLGSQLALLRLGAELLDSEAPKHEVGVEKCRWSAIHTDEHAHDDLGISARRQAEAAIVRAQPSRRTGRVSFICSTSSAGQRSAWSNSLTLGRHLAFHPAVDGSPEAALSSALVDGCLLARSLSPPVRPSCPMAEGGQGRGASGRNV